MSHEQDLAKWETIGTQFAPFKHKMFAECEEVFTFELLREKKGLSREHRSRLLSINELLCAWGIGTFQFKQALLDARAKRGLRQLAGIIGTK